MQSSKLKNKRKET